MSKKIDKDALRKPGDNKKSPQLGNNVVWYLVGVGLLTVVLVSLLTKKPQVELSYGDLIALIEQGAPQEPEPPGAGSDGARRKIDVTEGTEKSPRVVEYSNLSDADLLIDKYEITGKVDRRVLREGSRTFSDQEQKKDAGVRFVTYRKGFEDDGGYLLRALKEHQFKKFSAEQAEGPWSYYVFTLGLTLLLFLGVFLMLRRMGGAGSPMAFARSRGKMYAQEDIGVTFDDVAGIDEAVEELREVVEFLRNPEKYQVLGGRIPKGVLLVGPPGTGKTLLAKAIAGEAGVPFFSLSGSDFVEMFVGVGAARVRDTFQQAEAKAPCIIFIDELDALGKTRGSSIVGGHDEREQTLNAMLVEMDGFDSNSGVIVLAATNRPETLDPALLRPGRFDRHVLVDRPDVRGRERILDVHVQNVKLGEDVDLKDVARITSGFVGADLANLVNEAALLAARKGKTAVGMDEFNEGVERVTAGLEKKQRVMHLEEKQRVAYHESGHALVAYSLPNTDPVHKVSIIPRGLGALGYVMQRPEEDRYLLTQAELESRILVLLAGTMSEELIFNDVSTGAQNDLERASELARSMVMDYGMSRLGRVSFRESGRSPFLAGGGELPRERSHSEETAREIDQEIKRIINEALDKVRHILDARQQSLHAMAARLIEKEVIDAVELKAIIEATSASPLVVPGTLSERKRPGGIVEAKPDAGAAGAEA
ncbi:MAG: ATP-dependent zinc metalloprotease FtsH [Pirellulales bacterium]|nr:ATP-dependent zinc metalloprotease FtsH [Pirellulales bacterium]